MMQLLKGVLPRRWQEAMVQSTLAFYLQRCVISLFGRKPAETETTKARCLSGA